jgi:hypothetical protein
MSYNRRERTIPASAQELFNMHPGVGVSRQRTGYIEVSPFRDSPSPFMGFYTIIRLAQQRREETSSRLMFTSHLIGGGIDTELVFPYPGSLDVPYEVIRKTIEPELAVDMASAGIDLLAGYVSLSPDESRKFPLIPYGNEKVYDFSDFSQLQSSATFVAARELLLIEPFAQ